MKPLDRLKQEYKTVISFRERPAVYKKRKMHYDAMRAFALDCDLCTFNEIELMEYENK